MNSLPQREIENLWKLYESIINKLEDENVLKLIEDLGQRLAEQSMNQRTTEPFCGIGGVLEYSLELAKTARKLNETLNLNIDNKSLLKTALLSEIGRIGTDKFRRFKETTSDWHKEKLGQYYDWDDACPKYKVNEMTLWHIQNKDVSLSWEEWNTIMLLGDFDGESKKFYSNSKSNLSLCLLLAQDVVYTKENNRIKEEFILPF